MRIFIYILLIVLLILTACIDDEINTAPRVNAGVDQTVSIASNSIEMNPAVSDDGLPEESTLSFFWIVQNDQNNVTFDDHNSKQPSVTFDAAGVYVLELSVSDGELSTSDTVTIFVEEAVITACGNDVAEAGEVCDGTDLNKLVLPGGYASGTLECLADCSGFTINEAVKGNTITADSCSELDIEAALEKAVDGDTVQIPEGNCTWESSDEASPGVSVAKRVYIKGAGSDKTVITGYDDLESMLGLRVSGIWVSDIGFMVGTNKTAIAVRSLSGDDIAGFRIYQCHFESLSTTEGVKGVYSIGNSQHGTPVGVVDNCDFKNARVKVLGSLSMMPNGLWAETLNLGTNNATFVENCTFIRALQEPGNAIDSNFGSRYVFRHNDITDMYIEAHSVQSNWNRAARSWEIYDNDLRRVESSSACYNYAFSLRGGTGVVFNNTIYGNWQFLAWGNKGIAMDIKRNEGSLDSLLCDGETDFSKLWDGDGANGYPCRDQPGASTDSFVWTGDPDVSWGPDKWNNPAYPAPEQEVDPVCEWNNLTEGGEDIDIVAINDAHDLKQIQEGRDYLTNSKREGYVKYPHPHPLTTVEQ